MSGRSRLARLAAVALVVITGAGALGACSTNRGDKDVIRKDIARTRLLSRKFVYKEQPLAAKSVEVDGLVEDDFRYAADLKIDGATVRQEVASDDALALHFPDGSQANRFIDPSASATAAARPGELPTSQAIGVLSAGQWVQDNVGAPSLIVAANDKRKVGDDPILDSLTVFDYLDKAVQAAPRVVRFDPDSLTPTYKTKEDPFPKPKRGAAISRYDLAQVPLPRASAAPGARNAVPDVTNFRKLAIYVNQDGIIVRAMEVIDVANHLDDLKRNFKITDDITVQQAVDGLNKVRQFSGQDPIRVRTMTIEFQGLGQPQHVELPKGAALGNLAVIRYRGKAATPAASGANSSTTPASTPPDTSGSAPQAAGPSSGSGASSDTSSSPGA